MARAAADPRAEGPVLWLAPDDATARSVAADAAFFMGVAWRGGTFDVDGPVVVLPEVDSSPYADISADPRTLGARLAALARLSDTGEDRPRLVVASVRSFVRKVIPPTAFHGLCRTWEADAEVPREQAVEDLVAAGYQRVDVVEDPGTFAVRGGVMDVFVPRLRDPVRIEWFGDEVERLRLFDPQTQRSLRQVESVVIHPVRETVRTTEEDLRTRLLALGDRVNAPTSRTRQVIENLDQGHDFFGIEAITPLFHDALVSVEAHFPPGTRWLIDEPEALVTLAERLDAERIEEHDRAVADRRLVAPVEDFALEAGDLNQRFREAPVVASRLDLYDPDRPDEREPIRIDLDPMTTLHAAMKAARGKRGGEIMRPLVEHIRRLAEQPPWRVVLVAPNRTHAERMTSLLRGYGLAVDGPVPLELEPPQDGVHVQVVAGDLAAGFGSEVDRFLLLSEADVFGKVTRRHRAPRKKNVGVASLSQLAVGDYVVHVVHGVGRYTGLTKLSLKGIPADFVLIEYAGTDKLYLPVYRLGEIERYVAAEGKAPKLDKMGGATFATRTAKVKQEVRQMADELLQIYAQREALEGHAYPEPDAMYREFESTFPFEETPDQLDAIESVQGDLGRAQPLDRLICGDVGFGKTEVALRAAFRVVEAGKQVAVLAPTTVLVQQHHHTFADRMGAFGVKVGALNRFVSAKERKSVLEDLREGRVDVVIGTHRLLGKDVRFKDLGLLVIDEEQRFGVAQKERFKRFKTQVDVLTLTATPIPRTLHMSLLGIRDVSMIMTPPLDRLAVRTFITRQSDTVIEEGVRKELARGGQVFYVVPRILGIEEHARRIRELVPEARVIVAHGKMPGEMLEKTMVDFVEHRADVLVSTTIVESGLDIPRANTMFVARADMLGMAQLYQLRGRIGRSKRRAYCYLMVNALEKLAPEARRRLEAIQRHTQLGAGFNVASEDLEIRGAGDILGKRQNGHIQTIGFDAYVRMLEEAVAELRGQPIIREADPEIAFDVPAFLPDHYVDDTGQRLDLYRRLSAASDVDEVDGVLEEIRDRFGDPPIEVRFLGLVMGCKTYGRKLGALALEKTGARFSVRLGPQSALDPEMAAGLVTRRGRYRLMGTDRIATDVIEPRGDDHTRTLEACQAVLAELWSKVQQSGAAKRDPAS